jgi:hypothetical protein
LKSLRKLYQFDEITQQLVQFLFDPNFTETLHDFLDKESMSDLIALLKTMKILGGDREILDEETRKEIYMIILSNNKKLVVETFKLMVALEEDVWTQIIEVVRSDHDIDLPSFLAIISSIGGVDFDPEKVVKIVDDNANRPEISRTASWVLAAMVKQEKGEIVFKKLEQVLEKVLVDEKTFVNLLDCFDVVNVATMQNHYKDHATSFKKIIGYLLSAFDLFNEQKSLHHIVIMLKKFSKIGPQHVLEEVTKSYNSYYLELLQVYSQHKKVVPFPFTRPLVKLVTLLENHHWEIVPQANFPDILLMNVEFCSIAPADEPLLPIIIRFHFNVLKQMWRRMVNNESLLLESREISNGIESFMSYIHVLISRSPPKPLSEFYLVLCSFIDILVMFQPAMKERHEHQAFQMVKFVVTDEMAKILASLVEKFAVISDDDSEESIYQREMIMLSWVTFCSSYENLQTSTVFENILCHYKIKHPLKVYMDTLMEFLLDEREDDLFEKTIASSILNISNKNDVARDSVFP